MVLKSKHLERVRGELPLDAVAPPDPLVRVNLNVPKSVRKRWKEVALREERSLTDMIIQLVQAHVANGSHN